MISLRMSKGGVYKQQLFATLLHTLQCLMHFLKNKIDLIIKIKEINTEINTLVFVECIALRQLWLRMDRNKRNYKVLYKKVSF